MNKAIEMLKEQKECLQRKVERLDERIEHARDQVVNDTSERNQTLTAIQDIQSAIAKLSDGVEVAG